MRKLDEREQTDPTVVFDIAFAPSALPDVVTAAVDGSRGLVHSDPETVGGTPVFVGTRVPVSTLFVHLAAGDSLAVFLDDFPSVSREQAVAALQIAQDVLLGLAYAHARPPR